MCAAVRHFYLIEHYSKMFDEISEYQEFFATQFSLKTNSNSKHTFFQKAAAAAAVSKI